MDAKLLDILCCPITHKPLSMVPAAKLAELNEKIARGELLNRNGDALASPLLEALQTNDDRLIYPVVDGVPTLLEELCIDLASQPAES